MFSILSTSVAGVALQVFLLLVTVWAAIFGGIGALLARQRGGSAAMGFGWGFLLGPLGWAVVWFTTRAPSTAPRANGRVLELGEALADSLHPKRSEQTPSSPPTRRDGDW